MLVGIAASARFAKGKTKFAGKQGGNKHSVLRPLLRFVAFAQFIAYHPSMDTSLTPFVPYLERWNLEVDGSVITRKTSSLLPVHRDGIPLILKVSQREDDVRGYALLDSWAGRGCVRVLQHDGAAALMERAPDGTGLYALTGTEEGDDEASRILCATLKTLHTNQNTNYPEQLIPLFVWFRDLEANADTYGGIFPMCRSYARSLLSSQQEVIPLHGDLNHGNVLNFGEQRGWLAIDPVALLGESGFEYGVLFSNPELRTPCIQSRFHRQLAVVLQVTQQEPRRLLMWIAAQAGLSAIWFCLDGEPDMAERGMTVAAIAHNALAGTALPPELSSS